MGHAARTGKAGSRFSAAIGFLPSVDAEPVSGSIPATVAAGLLRKFGWTALA
jgi:hypothetical protein